MTIETINFREDAKRLILEWLTRGEDEREHIPSFATEGYGPLPFTVYDDFSVVLGNYTDGVVGGGNPNNAGALADQINDAAAVLDHQPSDITGNPEHDEI